MSGRGRKAALPSLDYRPPQRVFIDDKTCSVHFYQEEGGPYVVFDFAKLPVHRNLQAAMACAFDRLTGPAGTKRAHSSASLAYYYSRQFSATCAAAPNPPSCPQEITVAHVESHTLRRQSLASWPGERDEVRLLLLALDDLPMAVRAFLQRPGVPRRDGAVASYTKAEFKRIERAARDDLRAAAERIRRNIELLERWREGSVDRAKDPKLYEYGWLLDYVARTGDVPRYESGARLPRGVVYKYGSLASLTMALSPTWREAAAACVLLISSTGQNGGTLVAAPAAHHRPDGGAGGAAIALVNLVKPRRGRRTRYMSVPLTDLPPWTGVNKPGDVIVNERDELSTPFGIYTVLLELTDVVRSIVGSQRLFVYWVGHSSGRGCSPRAHIREGLNCQAITKWGHDRDLRVDQIGDNGDLLPLDVTMRRLRLTFLQRYERPVAHTRQTLANDYLVRDKGAVAEYQRVVAQAQAEQVEKARSFPLPLVLTEADVTQAVTDPEGVARRFKVTVKVLKHILAGKANTVLAACIDHNNSPYSPPGEPCSASFFMCLQCECARATPQHLSILVLVYDELGSRKLAMTPLAWTARFLKPYAQLEDLIGRFGSAAADAARRGVTDEDRILVRRFLNRELDVPR